MKRITVSLDEPTHRQARVKAAELGMSLSAFVRVFLNRLAAEPPMNELPQLGAETLDEQRQRLIEEAVAEINVLSSGLRMSENLPREAHYDRNAVH